MLLATTLGWFLVQKSAALPCWTIASHEEESLLSLQQKARTWECPLQEHANARYRFCMMLDGPALIRVMAALAERITYTDFLQAIAEAPEQNLKLELYRELDGIMKPIAPLAEPKQGVYCSGSTAVGIDEQDPSLDHYSAPHAMGELKKQQKERNEPTGAS